MKKTCYHNIILFTKEGYLRYPKPRTMSVRITKMKSLCPRMSSNYSRMIDILFIAKPVFKLDQIKTNTHVHEHT